MAAYMDEKQQKSAKESLPQNSHISAINICDDVSGY